MKLTSMIALAALAAAPFSGALAAGMEHSQADIKLLNDSAAALTKSRPALSSRLKTYAQKEAAEKETAETPKSHAEEMRDLQLVRDSAVALKASHPDLSKGLESYADREAGEHKQQRSPGY